MKKIIVIAALVCSFVITACGDQDAVTSPAPTVVATTTAVPSPIAMSASPTPAASPSPVRTSPTPAKPAAPVYTDLDSGSVITFSDGYPKIVSTSKISPRVDVETYFKDEKRAVALAPGVWTNLPEGAELQDAATGGPLIGLCASVKAFQRKNPDVSRGGTCW